MAPNAGSDWRGSSKLAVANGQVAIISHVDGLARLEKLSGDHPEIKKSESLGSEAKCCIRKEA